MTKFLFGALVALFLSSCNYSATENSSNTIPVDVKVAAPNVPIHVPVQIPRIEPPKEKCIPPEFAPAPPPIPKNAPPNSTYIFSGAPPERFMKNNEIEIQFESEEDVEHICRDGKPKVCGYKVLGCYKAGRLVMPNPCKYLDQKYAKLLCHELAHVNKWPPYHGD